MRTRCSPPRSATANSSESPAGGRRTAAPPAAPDDSRTGRSCRAITCGLVPASASGSCLHAVLRTAQRLSELFSPQLVQMLHNPTVLPAHVAVGFWMRPIAPENTPVDAAQLLAGGSASPALRVAGGLPALGDPRSIRSASHGAWWELAAGSPAARWLCPAQRCVQNEKHVQEGERRGR